MNDAETALYRCFDKDGGLVYVGISGAVSSRLGSHKSASAWFKFVVRIEIERFPDRAAAEEAERAAIATEEPQYNIRGRWGNGVDLNSYIFPDHHSFVMYGIFKEKAEASGRCWREVKEDFDRRFRDIDLAQ